MDKGETTAEWGELRKAKWKNVENNSDSDIIKRKLFRTIYGEQNKGTESEW